MPVRNTLVRNTRCHVEHDDSALGFDVVSVAKTREFLLSSSVPHVELDRPAVRVEHERVDLDAERRDVLLLELARHGV